METDVIMTPVPELPTLGTDWVREQQEETPMVHDIEINRKRSRDDKGDSKVDKKSKKASKKRSNLFVDPVVKKKLKEYRKRVLDTKDSKVPKKKHKGGGFKPIQWITLH